MPFSAENCRPFLAPDLDEATHQKTLATAEVVVLSGKADYADHIVAQVDYRGANVLEVGCHYCWYAPFFLARGAAPYSGIDVEFLPEYDQVHGTETIRTP